MTPGAHDYDPKNSFKINQTDIYVAPIPPHLHNNAMKQSFDQENLIIRLLFTIRIAHLKAETQEHPTFGQYVFNNTKALTKVTKDHQKKPKSLLATIIFNRLTVTINDGSSFKNRFQS